MIMSEFEHRNCIYSGSSNADQIISGLVSFGNSF